MVELIVEVTDNERELINILRKMRNVKNVRSLKNNYAAPGEPMSAATFKKRIARAEQDILDGKTYTTEEAKKMFYRHDDE